MISSGRSVAAIMLQLNSSGLRALSRRCISKDTYEKFVLPEVQHELRKMTMLEPQKTLNSPFDINKSPYVTLMTKTQLEEARSAAMEKARQVAQMPPVLPVRDETEEVISDDSEKLAAGSSHDYVFIDSTVGLPERTRRIVVRHADGRLCNASPELRDRMLQAYYPRRGRRLTPSALFHQENIYRLLNKGKYEYILSNACNQFEPDHPQYIDICEKVYNLIEDNVAYDDLLSTRHYGSMVFSLVINQNIKSFITHLLTKSRIEECFSLVKVYQSVWYDVKSAESSPETNLSEKSKLEMIEEFLKQENLLNNELKTTLQDLIGGTSSQPKQGKAAE